MNQPNPITCRNSAVRSRPLPGPQSVTVSFSVWEAQQVRVMATGGGSPAGPAVHCGDRGRRVDLRVRPRRPGVLRDGLEQGRRYDQTLRLGARPSAAPTASHDLTVLWHTVGRQRVSVVTEQAWTRADRLRAVLDPPATVIDPGCD